MLTMKQFLSINFNPTTSGPSLIPLFSINVVLSEHHPSRPLQHKYRKAETFFRDLQTLSRNIRASNSGFIRILTMKVKAFLLKRPRRSTMQSESLILLKWVGRIDLIRRRENIVNALRKPCLSYPETIRFHQELSHSVIQSKTWWVPFSLPQLNTCGSVCLSEICAWRIKFQSDAIELKTL